MTVSGQSSKRTSELTIDRQADAVEWTTEDIASKIVAGDDDAEAQFVQRYSRWLRLILFKRIKDAELALDLTQQALLTVLIRLRKRPLDEPAKLDNFVYRTAINLFINDARQKSRRRTFADSERIENIPAPDPSPFDALVREQMSAAIIELMKKLPTDRDREILYRFYILGDEKALVCQDLNISLLHFNRVLYRARQRFRKLLQQSTTTNSLRGAVNGRHKW